jgi:hypothetical protein
MKKNIFAVLVFVAASMLSFADDYIYIGPNYTASFSKSGTSNGIGLQFSAIGEYSNTFKIYSAIGYVYNINAKDDFIKSSELSKLGIKSFDINLHTLPLRIGYPFSINIAEKMRIFFIPALAFDIQFFSANFTQRIAGFKINYNMRGFGYSVGPSFNVCVQNKFTDKLYIRYGIDFDMPLITLMFFDCDYSGAIHGSTSDAKFSTFADNFMLSASPYVCIGFKIK